MHNKVIEMIHIIVFSLIYSKWGMCLKNIEKKKRKKKERERDYWSNEVWCK